MRQAVGLTVHQTRLLAQRSNAISRTKSALRCKRSGRNKVCRKMLDGGSLSEAVMIQVDGVPITVANILSPMWLLVTKESMEWLVTSLYADMRALSGGESTAHDESGVTMTEIVFDDQNSDDDEETIHYTTLAADLKSAKDPR